jgi:hypothetical protein
MQTIEKSMPNDRVSGENTKGALVMVTAQPFFGRRRRVWFADPVERMIRLWLAKVNHDVIAAVLGRGITGKAVQSKARRVGMLPRQGLILTRDIEIAREIDREAAPLPEVIRDHRNRPGYLRRDVITGVACYSPAETRLSPQAKEAKTYEDAVSAVSAALIAML